MTDIVTISVRLDIPAQKVLAQAMEISESYKPIVSKALEEARENLLFDEKYKTRVKDLVRIKIEEILKMRLKMLSRKLLTKSIGLFKKKL